MQHQYQCCKYALIAEYVDNLLKVAINDKFFISLCKQSLYYEFLFFLSFVDLKAHMGGGQTGFRKDMGEDNMLVVSDMERAREEGREKEILSVGTRAALN